MESTESDISDIWDCEESVLEYMIEPKGSLKIIDKKDYVESTVEELNYQLLDENH